MQGIELAGMPKCMHLKVSGVMAFVEFIQHTGISIHPLPVAVLTSVDYNDFRSKMTNFFNSIPLRNPRDGETPEPLFQNVLEYVEDLEDPSVLLETRGKHRFCELRVYETRGKRAYGWQTSRRLVLTSPPYEPQPWSKSFCRFSPVSE